MMASSNGDGQDIVAIRRIRRLIKDLDFHVQERVLRYCLDATMDVRNVPDKVPDKVSLFETDTSGVV